MTSPVLLVVDDAPEMAALSRLLGRRVGQEIVCQPDVEGALAWLGDDTHRPDLLLIDLNLVGSDGVAAYRFLRQAMPRLGSVPAALFTQGASAEWIAAAVDAGFGSLISKELLAHPEGWRERVEEILHPDIAPALSELPTPARWRQALASVDPAVARAVWRLAAGEGSMPRENAPAGVDGPSVVDRLTNQDGPPSLSNPAVLLPLVDNFLARLDVLLGRRAFRPARDLLAPFFPSLPRD